MSALLATLMPYLIAAGAALVAIVGVYAKGRSAGADKIKAKEAEKRAENLNDVRRAQDAAAGVRAGDPAELSDPNNRDVRR